MSVPFRQLYGTIHWCIWYSPVQTTFLYCLSSRQLQVSLHDVIRPFFIWLSKRGCNTYKYICFYACYMSTTNSILFSYRWRAASYMVLPQCLLLINHETTRKWWYQRGSARSGWIWLSVLITHSWQIPYYWFVASVATVSVSRYILNSHSNHPDLRSIYVKWILILR